ncbi:MAG: hypothetical protein ACREL1_00315 [bacterium]
MTKDQAIGIALKKLGDRAALHVIPASTYCSKIYQVGVIDSKSFPPVFITFASGTSWEKAIDYMNIKIGNEVKK